MTIGEVSLDVCRVFSPIRERADKLLLMKKNILFGSLTVSRKLQNNDIIA